MVKIENHCVGCDTCIGTHCRNRRVLVYYCDKCKEELGDEIYDVDGMELCEDCTLKMFRRKN